MSTLSDALWYASPAVPLFLKRGVLGALCAWANDDGTFQYPPTVKRLTDHRYPNNRRLCERIVRYQLRLLEKLETVSAPPHVGGRGIVRQYQMHPDAIAAITVETVQAAAYAKGANKRHDAKGALKGAIATRKGGNSGLYIDKKRKREKAPESAGAVWARLLTLAKLTLPKWERSRLDQLHLAADCGSVLHVRVNDPDVRGFLQRQYGPQLGAAAATEGVQLNFVS